MLTCDCGGVVEIWTNADLSFSTEPIAECTECDNKWNRFGAPLNGE